MAIEVLSIHTPPFPRTAAAMLRVTDVEQYDKVVDVGLNALGETKVRLFGFGVEGWEEDDIIHDADVRVYAERD